MEQGKNWNLIRFYARRSYKHRASQVLMKMVVFDFDGVILDSFKCVEHCSALVAQRLLFPIPIVNRGESLWTFLTHRMQLNIWQRWRFMRLVKKELTHHYDSMQVFPPVIAAINTLVRTYPIGI